MKGRIIKSISNQYTVLLESQEIVLAYARGKIRLDKAPVCGDFVEVFQFEDAYGIEKLYPRHNELIRPLIANVDQAIIVMSAIDPDFSTTLVDQLIFLIVHAKIEPVLLVSKMDLIKKDDPIHEKLDDYRKSGYLVIETGTGYNNDEIIEVIQNKVSVLTGQSGVGKSSFLNRVDPSFQLRTQITSKALGRGKHTTRHVELHRIKDGWVADTPGFSKLDFSKMTPLQLEDAVKDFKKVNQECKFRDCLHIHEPNCAVKNAVESNEISKIRYLHYKQIVKAIQEGKRNLYD